MIDRTLEFFCGVEEWDYFVKACKKISGDERTLKHASSMELPDSPDCGREFAGRVWVGIKDPELVFHEAQHALQSVFDSLWNEHEEEFSAHIAGYVNARVFNWIISK